MHNSCFFHSYVSKLRPYFFIGVYRRIKCVSITAYQCDEALDVKLKRTARALLSPVPSYFSQTYLVTECHSFPLTHALPHQPSPAHCAQTQPWALMKIMLKACLRGQIKALVTRVHKPRISPLIRGWPLQERRGINVWLTPNKVWCLLKEDKVWKCRSWK